MELEMLAVCRSLGEEYHAAVAVILDEAEAFLATDIGGGQSDHVRITLIECQMRCASAAGCKACAGAQRSDGSSHGLTPWLGADSPAESLPRNVLLLRLSSSCCHPTFGASGLPCSHVHSSELQSSHPTSLAQISKSTQTPSKCCKPKKHGMYG